MIVPVISMIVLGICCIPLAILLGCLLGSLFWTLWEVSGGCPFGLWRSVHCPACQGHSYLPHKHLTKEDM